MKILILHQHFNTPEEGGAIRSYYLAKALVDAGIETVVITAHSKTQYEQKVVEGMEVHYLPIAYNNRFGFYKRSLSFIRFINGAVRLTRKIKNVDWCYAISVPLTIGVAAKRIKSKYKIPYIFEVGDLWPEAPIQMGFIKNPLFKSLLYKLEKNIYKHASAVVALSTAIKASVENTSPGKVVHLIPNMADTGFYYPQVKNKTLEVKYNVDGKFVVSYIGALGIANGLDYYIECARYTLRANLPVHFILCGDGAMLGKLTSLKNRLDLKNLSIIPFQNREGVKEIMNITDASFICYKPIPVLETGSPNKYFDGLAAGKLIIVNFGGWIKEEIEREHCGVFVHPNKPESFPALVSDFITNNEKFAHYQKASRTLALKKYSRKNLSEEFVSIFKA